MYKIQVKISGSWVQLTTANLEACSVTKAIESGHIFARQTVNGKIIFYGDDFVLLEAYLPTLQQIEAQIYRTEPSATGVATGYLNLAGSWDYDRKVCELSFNVVDDYTTIFEQWDESLPRIATTSIYDVKVLLTSETMTLVITSTGSHPPEEHNWKWVSTFGNEHTYKKQIIYLPASGWENDEGLPDFGSTLWNGETVTLNGEIYTDEYLFPVIRYAYSKRLTNPTDVEITLENFNNLADILEDELAEIDIDLPVNYCPYFTSDGELTNLMITQKSYLLSADKKPSSKRLTVKQYLDFFKIAFNLDWYISGGSLYFVHPSERAFLLPSPDNYPKHYIEYWGVQMDKYTYKSDELPFKELWQVEKSYEDDFDGQPIRYSEGVSKNQIEYDLSQFQFNLAAVMIAGDADAIRKEDISEDGYCVVACNSQNEVITKSGIIWPDRNLVNGKLTISRLQDEHHRTGDRYFTTGTMNGETETFTNIRTRKEATFQLPAFVTDFNFDYLVNTGHGNMRLISVTEFFNGKFAEIKLEI